MTRLNPMGLPWEVNEIGSGYGAALLFCWFVGRASHGFRGPVGALLGLAPLRYIGKISYGIYVYHLFVPGLFAFALGIADIAYKPARLEAFLILSTITVIVASISWYAPERPLNDLERFFPMDPGAAGPRRDVAALKKPVVVS